ncbi:MAG: ComEC/Rec2-related protein [Candidatus Collierbacteria bacterium GW2011_GWC2_44_18]|uniref:ComEC/Rec2-related protein n=1 Tax=Candidatus Collierbacteria bacterium GW2011_GWC2_44_18 TaxID=1618392 RepID=A0A0G1HRP4_9BACT|nr:MAG: ComEC/Rec2-related protein [Microgenomates group bacterium GW2011_GWC1_44_10]KKT49590.1 MAG: ComEC/Rec2-related protein [Candidatus Collierbacteria bacterium GW2011_GWC2_44_18]
MKKRILILLLLLGLRCILGWLSIIIFEPGEKIRITGYPNTLYQDGSKCIIRMSQFIFFSEDICAKYRDNRIEVIGNIDKRVIDSFGGKLWLVNAKIEIKERSQELKKSRTQDGGFVSNFRDKLVSIYKKSVPEPEAGLIAGIVLGYKKDIGQELYQQMIKSGSVHIAVASGYNILLVGSVVLSLSFWFVRRSVAIWIALIVMIFYAALAGGDPPVIRAVWMAGMMYVGQILGRGNQGWWTLTLSAWAMLMFDPGLLSSASFQLSVGASFGLIVVEPYLAERWLSLSGEGLTRLMKNLGVTTTLSTMFVTMPIIWWHFGRMSLFGILSNILILPFVPPLMIFGVGMLVFPWIFSMPTYALAHWMVLIIRFFGSS